MGEGHWPSLNFPPLGRMEKGKGIVQMERSDTLRLAVLAQDDRSFLFARGVGDAAPYDAQKPPGEISSGGA